MANGLPAAVGVDVVVGEQVKLSPFTAPDTWQVNSGMAPPYFIDWLFAVTVSDAGFTSWVAEPEDEAQLVLPEYHAVIV
jgi:hypothetical protein